VLDDIKGLEARWSRFRTDSELSRLNAHRGRATIVSAVTSQLLQRAVWAWRATAGRFDPTVLDAVIGAGYDRSFEMIDREVSGFNAGLSARPPSIDNMGLHQRATPGCEDVLIDPQTNLVILPPDVGIDPGGIGKGLAADLTATNAVASGATAALVSLGGDLRVAGTPPGEGWEVEVDHHLVEPARINLRAGALATSSVLRRRWETPDGRSHHIIDPRTGSPSNGDAVAVSVVAGEAWWAEALATTILVGFRDDGFTLELDDLLGPAGALVTLSDRSQHTFGSAGHAFSLEVAA
jgi:thiamine biosynthesis lipoprotein